MADNSLRYRMNPGYSRSRPSINDEAPELAQERGLRSGGERDGDPLAELARLVGEVDPAAARGPGVRREPTFNSAARERYDSPPSDEGHQTDRDYLTEQTQAPPLSNYQYETPHDDYSYRRQSYAADDPAAEQESYEQADGREPHPHTHDSEYREHQRDAADAQYADEQYADQQYEDERYADDQRQDERYADDQHPDDAYAAYENTGEETPRRRRRGLVTVAAVLCLAVIGTASAYAYRTFFGGGTAGAPPVIKADTTPNKIVANAGEAGTNKPIVDRMGDRGQNERVVPREEQPLDIPKPSRAPTQPTVGGWPMPPGSPPVSSSPSGQSPGSSASDARPVKTVTISPNAGQVAPQPPASAPAVRPPSDTAPAATRAPSQRAPTPRAEQNSPLSLAPQSEAATAAMAPARTPPPAAPAAHRYVVQLSASNTREEAAAALRSAQAKYASLLGGRQTQIKEKKSSDRPTVYAAQIGPMATKEEAQDLCHRLKTAGGDCFVPVN